MIRYLTFVSIVSFRRRKRFGCHGTPPLRGSHLFNQRDGDGQEPGFPRVTAPIVIEPCNQEDCSDVTRH